MTIVQLKQHTREAMRTRLGGIPATMRKEYSTTIVKRILSLASFEMATIVMGFVPLAAEPDLSVLYDRALEMGKTVALPRCIGTSTMEFYRMPTDWRDHITMNKFHVGEPDTSCTSIVTPSEDERILVLVPALAYTPHRRRLGRGGGFYDQYLARLESRGTYVGVCFSVQIESELPTEEHDLSVNLVVTETALY